jgi:multidrug efflux pump subunit AcrA (membrane-fusion protein)
VRAAAPPPPPVVGVAPVIQKDVPVQGEWVGALEGYVNAQIQPQVSGYLIRQDYHEGAFVKKCQLLFEIDPRPFQAVLDQAKGQLAQAEAQISNAETNLKRDIPEAEAHAIPQSQLDTDTQSLRGAKAAVEAAQASVKQAELNLGYTRVVSLVDGIAGINTVQVGNLVGPSAQQTDQPSEVLYKNGGASYLQVLTSETNYFSAELNLVQAQLNERLAFVQLLPSARRRMATVMAYAEVVVSSSQAVLNSSL